MVPHKCLLQHFIDMWKWRPEGIANRVEHDLEKTVLKELDTGKEVGTLRNIVFLT